MKFLSLWQTKEEALPKTEPRLDMARHDADPMAAAIADLLTKLKALAASAKTGEPAALREFAEKRHGPALGQMRTNMEKISASLRSLAVQSAHGASHLDPNVLGRILDRMDSLGDATLFQIEGRIGVTVSREDRKHLQNLRDETRKWMDARDAHLEEAQRAVDELNDRAQALRDALMARADRLMKAAEISAPVAQLPPSAALKHASPEVAGFASSLHALTTAARLPQAG